MLVLLAALLPTAPGAQQRSSAQPAQPATQSQPTPSTRLGTAPGTKAELSEDQKTKQEALFKSDPRLKEWAKRLEERGGRVNSWGNTDEAGMAAVGIKPSGQPSSAGGNRNAAAAAYKRKDYQAALQHYKALAAEGDTEAAVMLGIMHEKGEGVDKDAAAAYAWYGRAADQGDPVATEIVRDMNDKDQIKQSELDAAATKYEEIAQELDDPATAQDAGKRFEKIREDTNVTTEIYER
jgi:TPR repeat protein